MMLRRCSAELLMIRAYVRCTWSREVSISIDVSPITAFIGVRNSWLIIARNVAWVREAVSAESRASAIALSLRLRCVMSVKVRTRPPPGISVVRTSRIFPFGRSRS